MNKAIYNFPRTNPLTCTWIETGDPRHPLARVWMDAEVFFLKATSPASGKTEVEGIRLCA